MENINNFIWVYKKFKKKVYSGTIIHKLFLTVNLRNTIKLLIGKLLLSAHFPWAYLQSINLILLYIKHIFIFKSNAVEIIIQNNNIQRTQLGRLKLHYFGAFNSLLQCNEWENLNIRERSWFIKCMREQVAFYLWSKYVKQIKLILKIPTLFNLLYI